MKATLILEDGSSYEGVSFGSEIPAAGELVFNTAMTGYPESLTDPSYKGQALALTYPLIGNYGAPKLKYFNDMPDYLESEKIRISALVVSDYSERFNHWNAEKSLGDWLKEEGIPAVYAIDTRALTKKLREKGTMLCKLVFGSDIDFYDPNKVNLVDSVSTKDIVRYGSGRHRIVLVDCGVKYNIIRYLLTFDTTIVRVPWDYDFNKEDYDGLFISNGPGDPKMCAATVSNLKKTFERDSPIFGICLGNQLMALAAGADTYKLKYGHRSHNQPVLSVGTDRAFITSQNHGFAVNEATLGDEWKAFFKNLNDDTNEGICHKSKPFFSVQFHPEAAGGPTDTGFLFSQFIEKIESWKAKSRKY